MQATFKLTRQLQKVQKTPIKSMQSDKKNKQKKSWHRRRSLKKQRRRNVALSVEEDEEKERAWNEANTIIREYHAAAKLDSEGSKRLLNCSVRKLHGPSYHCNCID